MTVKQLLTVLECDSITICYAGFGQRIYKGTVIDLIKNPKCSYVLNYFVTLVIPHDNHIYIEVHENKNFLED